jgi:hypothetical protein
MAIYVVMEPGGGRTEAADATIFVRDGFSWLAFLFAPLWLAWHRLWVEAALAFVAMGLISLLGQRLGLDWAGSALSLLVSLYIGLEGQGRRIAALRRRGWHEWGVIEADNPDAADIRQALDAEAQAEEQAPLPRIVPDASLARPAQTGLTLGLTHTPGKG